jgi:hypothetical protein
LAIAFLSILYLLIFSGLLIMMNTTTAKVRAIDLTDCLADITSNIISASPEHYLLPSDIFEDLILQAINDLIDAVTFCV